MSDLPCNLCLVVLIQSALLGLPLFLHALERLLVGLHPLALLVLYHRRRGAPHLPRNPSQSEKHNTYFAKIWKTVRNTK